MITRRGLLTGLLALPLLRLLPKAPEPEVVGIDLAHGTDQTSIWVVGWGQHPMSYAFQPITYDRPVKMNWLKRELNR